MVGENHRSEATCYVLRTRDPAMYWNYRKIQLVRTRTADPRVEVQVCVCLARKVKQAFVDGTSEFVDDVLLVENVSDPLQRAVLRTIEGDASSAIAIEKELQYALARIENLDHSTGLHLRKIRRIIREACLHESVEVVQSSVDHKSQVS